MIECDAKTMQIRRLLKVLAALVDSAKHQPIPMHIMQAARQELALPEAK